MGIDFYYVPGSSPCRAVLLAAKAVGVEMNLKYTDLMKGEHLTPEFLKMNPQHTLPTINDNGFCLWESRAIMTYLVQQYGKDDKLYPKDPKERALVDQKLYFDMGTLYQRFGDLYYGMMFGGQSFDETKHTSCQDGFKLFEQLLEGSEYAASGHLTIADLALAATTSTYEACGFDLSPYPKVIQWYNKIKSEAPGYEEANGKNAQVFKELYETLVKK